MSYLAGLGQDDIAAAFRQKRQKRLMIQAKNAQGGAESGSPAGAITRLPPVHIEAPRPIPRWAVMGAGGVSVALLGLIGYAIISRSS